MSRSLAIARFVVRAAARGLRTSPGSGALAVLAMSLALVLAGAFGVAVSNVERVLARVGDELTISAYLDPAVAPAERALLAANAARIPGVRSVEVVSPQQALLRLPAEAGVAAGLADLLDENPLPASLDVRLLAEGRSEAGVASVRDALARLPGVADVSGGVDDVAGFARATVWLRSGALAVGAVLALATLVIVAGTVRLGLRERRDELAILALVGASPATVRLPFLLEGLAKGALAGALALGLLALLYAAAGPAVNAALAFLAGPEAARFLDLPQMTALVAGGGLLGVAGAALSLAADARA